MSGIDHYRVLGVPPSATRRAIREAYLGKVRSLHPDRVGSEGTALFQQITEAYEILSDPEKRRTYDRTRRAGVADKDVEPATVGFESVAEPLVPTQQQTANDVTDLHAGWVDDFLRSVVSGSGLTHAHRSPADSIELQVTLTPGEASRGAVLPLVLPVVVPCRWCGGMRSTIYLCMRCGGSGELVEERVLRIRIPGGVRNGSVMEVPLGPSQVTGPFLRLHFSVRGEGGPYSA